MQIETILKNYDNTGIIKGKIIHVYKGRQRRIAAELGDQVLIASQKNDYSKLQKRKMTRAIIIKTRKNKKRQNGHYITFKNSGFLTLHEKNIFKAFRIRGPVTNEMRYNKTEGITTTAKTLL